MLFGAVGDFTVFVGSVRIFRGQRVIIVFKNCLGLPLCGEATGTLFLVSVNVNAGALISFPVSGDGVVLFESGKEVFGVEFLHTINAEITDYE